MRTYVEISLHDVLRHGVCDRGLPIQFFQDAAEVLGGELGDTRLLIWDRLSMTWLIQEYSLDHGDIDFLISVLRLPNMLVGDYEERGSLSAGKKTYCYGDYTLVAPSIILMEGVVACADFTLQGGKVDVIDTHFEMAKARFSGTRLDLRLCSFDSSVVYFHLGKGPAQVVNCTFNNTTIRGDLRDARFDADTTFRNCFFEEVLVTPHQLKTGPWGDVEPLRTVRQEGGMSVAYVVSAEGVRRTWR